MQAPEQESALEPARRRLHEQLLLPLDRPLLRLGNATVFGDNLGGRLRNVHEGLKPSGVQGGRVHAIWGIYSYHHYMQVRILGSSALGACRRVAVACIQRMPRTCGWRSAVLAAGVRRALPASRRGNAMHKEGRALHVSHS